MKALCLVFCLLAYYSELVQLTRMACPETTAQSGLRSAEDAKEQRAVAAVAVAAVAAVSAAMEQAGKIAAVLIVGSSAVGVVGLAADSR